MELSITYAELEDFIRYRYRKAIKLSAIDKKKLCISYKVALLLPSVKLWVQIDEIKDTNIILSYDNSLLTGKLLDYVLPYLAKHFNEQIEMEGKHRAVVHLAKVKNLEKVFEYLILTDIQFGETNINLYVSLKTITTNS
jgi:hypothetical protein